MRHTFIATMLLIANLAALGADQAASPAPTNNPVARFGIAWTDGAKWGNVATVTDFEGKTWDERFAAAQAAVVKKGGGVVYFPAGTYEFSDHIKLESHVIVRGAGNTQYVNARDGEYNCPTRFEFPKFVPKCEGDGTPAGSAFKGIRQVDPNKTTHNGVINIHLERGHIKFGCDVYVMQEFIDGFNGYGRNHIVYGCILRQAAILDPNVPQAWQPKWQRWTHRHNGAIDIRAYANVLVANNRIPQSDEADFPMKGYLVQKGKGGKDTVAKDIIFHYDNRPGIYVNYGTVTEPLEKYPHCYAKGIEIRENYVYCYGCLAVGFSGDGTKALSNVIRYKPNAYLPAYTGQNESNFTNNNRGMEMRGYRWTVAYNDYEVYSNTHDNPSMYGGHYGDGEGLMHEQHNNCMIRDSKLLYNIGNRYLCMWRCPVDGLLIQGNIIRPSPGSHGTWGEPAITVRGRTHKTKELLPVKNCHIIDNITEHMGIIMQGKDGENNIIRGNRHVGGRPARIENQANATVGNNEGYTE